MEVDLAVLADAANKTESGKLNILGIFDRFTLGPDFPTPTPTFVIVIRVVGHPSEAGTHQVVLRLADADGREIAKQAVQFQATPKQTTPKPYRVPIIVGSQATIPHPGDYTLDVLIDGRWETAIPLTVEQRSP